MKATCDAKTRQGTPCQRAPMPNGRCSKHGGTSLAGIASPRFTTGRWSSMLPTRLAARYQEAQHDRELLALWEEVALVDARIADILGRVDTGESGQRWQELQGTAAVLRLARRQQNAGAITDALNTMLELISSGRADYAAWADVRMLLEQRRRLVESERRRLVELQQVITVERAMALIGAIAGIIRAHVTDRTVLAAISADLERLVQHRPLDSPDT